MNTNAPHDIVDVKTLFGLPEEKRKTYVKITPDEEEYLRDKSESERAKWLTLPFKKRLAILLRKEST